MRYTKLLSLLAIVSLYAVLNSCDDENNPPQEDTITLSLITDDLESPVLLTESPDNTGRLFIVDKPGKIYIVKDGALITTPFLDISSKLVPLNPGQDERGLLGLAFHPDFESNHRFYVYYSSPLREEAPPTFNHTSVIAEYTVSAGNADLADTGSEKIILEVDEPQSNHNGGMIAFGPDDKLYISLGDGGGSNDTGTGHVSDWYTENGGGNAQNIDNLLGSILRIDVDGGDPYSIPDDNPFVDEEGLDEIYAYGFRNPYRFCFDPAGKIIVADAGQELYEEVDLVEKGGNYGWNVKEGAHCFDAESNKTPPASCPDEDGYGNAITNPVIEFKNVKNFSDGLGNVSVGGFVYQGDNISSLNGMYIFGVLTQDPSQAKGALFAANRSGNLWSYSKLTIKDTTLPYVLGFGQDAEGEVYVLTNGDGAGKVFKLAP